MNFKNRISFCWMDSLDGQLKSRIIALFSLEVPLGLVGGQSYVQVGDCERDVKFYELFLLPSQGCGERRKLRARECVTSSQCVSASFYVRCKITKNKRPACHHVEMSKMAVQMMLLRLGQRSGKSVFFCKIRPHVGCC